MDTLSPPMDACRLLVTREGTRGRGGGEENRGELEIEKKTDLQGEIE